MSVRELLRFKWTLSLSKLVEVFLREVALQKVEYQCFVKQSPWAVLQPVNAARCPIDWQERFYLAAPLLTLGFKYCFYHGFRFS